MNRKANESQKHVNCRKNLFAPNSFVDTDNIEDKMKRILWISDEPKLKSDRRKSLSMTDLTSLFNLCEDKKNSPTSKHLLNTCSNDTMRLNISKKQDLYNRLSQPKCKDLRNNYVSFAEAVQKFHQKTPKRFLTLPRKISSDQIKYSKSKFTDKPNTGQHSPSLTRFKGDAAVQKTNIFEKRIHEDIEDLNKKSKCGSANSGTKEKAVIKKLTVPVSPKFSDMKNRRKIKLT